ncbi:hypothetical protein QP572_14350, partial [Brevibacterium sp. UMB10442]|nr:hypothetical protein [Brevibacterium sp. UMB10442]
MEYPLQFSGMHHTDDRAPESAAIQAVGLDARQEEEISHRVLLQEFSDLTNVGVVEDPDPGEHVRRPRLPVPRSRSWSRPS